MSMNERITPCDYMKHIPVYFTRRTVNGIKADVQMFSESWIIVLRYVEDDGKNRDILVRAPRCFREGLNFYNTDEGRWMYV